MTINLRESTVDNARSVRALRCTPEQERFVSSVTDSLTEADKPSHGNPWFRAVYADERPVGFVMLSWNDEPQLPGINGPWVLGNLLLTSYVPGDGGPADSYTRLAFVPTRERDPVGETILRRSVHE